MVPFCTKKKRITQQIACHPSYERTNISGSGTATSASSTNKPTPKQTKKDGHRNTKRKKNIATLTNGKFRTKKQEKPARPSAAIELAVRALLQRTLETSGISKVG